MGVYFLGGDGMSGSIKPCYLGGDGLLLPRRQSAFFESNFSRSSTLSRVINHISKMSSSSRCVLVAMVVLAAVSCCLAKTLGQPGEKERLMSELDLVDEDGSVETALINYLFAKQIVNRMRAQADVTDLQRKRSYWKQCAFNAVSCFG